MKNRREQIFEYGSSVLAERFEANTQLIHQYYMQNREAIEQDFLNTYSRVFSDAIRLQAAGRKQPVKWICTSYLRSSILTGDPKFHISLYDAGFILDKTEIQGYWHTDFLFQPIRDDMSFLTRQLKKEFIRVMDYEIKDFSIQYAQLFFALAEYIHDDLASLLIELPCFLDMDKTAPVHFTFGEYLDRGRIVYSYEKEGQKDGILFNQG